MRVWDKMTVPVASTSKVTPHKAPKPRFAHHRRIVHPHTGEAFDDGLAIYFPGAPRVFVRLRES